MNVLIDVRAVGKGEMSGIEEYTRLLVGKLLHAGGKHTYTLFANGLRKPLYPAEWNAEQKARVEWRVPNKLLDVLCGTFRRPRADVTCRADIVWSPNINVLGTSQNAKRVITFHDLSFVHFPEFYPWRSRVWHGMQRYEREARKAARIVAVSEFTARDVAETLRVPRERIVTIYPGINPLYARASDGEMREFRKAQNLEHPFILFVGVLEPRKNIPSIIRTFEIIKRSPHYGGMKLVIAGRRGWLCDTIFREAECSRVKNDICFWGAASFDDLRLLYSSCEAFMYPSFFEGFGFPPLEAQACGAPVIAGNRSSLPEVLGTSALLLDPWNVDEHVAALRAIVERGTVRETLIRKGYENIRRFSWDRAAVQLTSLFESL